VRAEDDELIGIRRAADGTERIPDRFDGGPRCVEPHDDARTYGPWSNVVAKG
jgi:hypothetical protein